MFEFSFMQHAFIGCFLVSVLAGIVGWFMLLRRQTFAAHALPHIGFSGAAAAVWIGFSPLLGMIGSSLIAGFFIAHEGHKTGGSFHPLRRETMTGLALTASLGLGVWCLHEANTASNQATTLLFGDVLSLSTTTLMELGGVFLLCIILLGALWRPLLFSSLSPDLAEARGVSVSHISRSFMILAALATSACSEIAGALLSFSLMIGPASAALRLELSPLKGIIFSIIAALALSWSGLILSWFTDAPVSFWISIGAVLLYSVVSCIQRLKLKLFNKV
ncbi:metal ABC transporter permease [Saccharibacter sp. 17.LH.SD]|uniref:metal ABC transporter permease n=1 Tax=Saccharibacter sp. 17.LH.SD TaxID=2689393 RepID=UPI001370166A|nr:metal ABC transporter permease [Saccharibacter sp. 17.LH.SD]MXV45160.1 metal ABC transporter permease [Saccharibacter sp. 17.LH.SD]